MSPGGVFPEPGRHLALVGVTASGKSAVAMALARRAASRGEAVELLGVDSMTVYRGMDIGTATPTPAEQAEVPHHLFNLVDPHEPFSVARLRREADAALEAIEARGARAVLVGGTGLYHRALIDRLEIPGRYPEVRAELEGRPTLELAERLARLDPEAAARIEPGNRRRYERALEVTIGSGRPFSSFGPGLEAYPPSPFVLVGIRVDREVAARRIRERIEMQLEQGWLEECRRLLAGPALSSTAAQALGYADLFDHLERGVPLTETVERIVRSTRRTAVRQERWFRRDPRILWFDRPDGSPEQVADSLAAAIESHWRSWPGVP